MAMQNIRGNDNAGEFLRRTRMRLGLTTRQVSDLSKTIVAQQGRDSFSISHACLVQVENQQSVPSIFKLFTLSAIYGVCLTEILAWYMDLKTASHLHASLQHATTHLTSLEGGRNGHTPVTVDTTEAALANTRVLSQDTRKWGELPLPAPGEADAVGYRYGLIGMSDYTMYPLIRPGSFVQIQNCQKPAPSKEYRAELDRPIYFIEIRSGYICSWCEIVDGRLISIPHPLSPCRTRQFSYPCEAEIIGRVTGVMIRLSPVGAAQQAAPKPAGLSIATPAGNGGGANTAGVRPEVADARLVRILSRPLVQTR